VAKVPVAYLAQHASDNIPWPVLRLYAYCSPANDALTFACVCVLVPLRH